MAARGSGLGTQLILDSHYGTNGAILAPNDGSFSVFTNAWFNQTYGAGSIGRSFEFGDTNTFWEKRKGLKLAWTAVRRPAKPAP